MAEQAATSLHVHAREDARLAVEARNRLPRWHPAGPGRVTLRHARGLAAGSGSPIRSRYFFICWAR